MFLNIVKSRHFFFLILFALTLRVLWFFVPLELDEGTYMYISSRWKEGINPYSLPDNKTPFVYINYLALNIIVGNSFLLFRLASAAMFFSSLFLLVYFVYKLDKDRNQAILSGFFYAALSHIPLVQGHLNKLGSFFNIYFVISLIFLNRYLQTKSAKDFMLSSLFYGIAFLSLSLNLWFIGLFSLSLIYFHRKRLDSVISYLGLPALLCASLGVFFFLAYKSNLFLRAHDTYFTFFHHFLSIGGYHNIDFKWPFFMALLPFIALMVLGLLNIEALKRFQRTALFFSIGALLLISILPSYGHYLLPIVPIVSIFSGKIFSKKREAATLAIFSTLLFLLISSIPYYPGMNRKDSMLFQDFDSYEEQSQITRFLEKNLLGNETFYYWGWNPGIYWLTGRPYPFESHSFILKCGETIGITPAGEEYRPGFDISSGYLLIPMHYPTDCKLFGNLYGNEKLHLTAIGNVDVYRLP